MHLPSQKTSVFISFTTKFAFKEVQCPRKKLNMNYIEGSFADLKSQNYKMKRTFRKSYLGEIRVQMHLSLKIFMHDNSEEDFKK